MTRLHKKTQHDASPVLAGLLSVVPGVGQIYAGSAKRGVMIMLALGAQVAVLLIAGVPQALLWLIPVWLWNVLDAIRLAAGLSASLTVPIVVLSVLNLTIGWQSSEMGTQIRQLDPASGLAQSRSLVAALTQPDLFKPFELQTADADLSIFLDSGGLVSGTSSRNTDNTDTEDTGPRLALESSAGETITAVGNGFAPRATGWLFLRAGGDKKLADFTTDADGGFEVEFRNPVEIPGNYWIEAEVRRALPVTQWSVSNTLRSSMKLMLETIFLAFLGTLIALVISLPLSFLAARNLTGQIPGGWAVYSITRAVFNILRSIEVLIIAVIMAIIVGIGPLAGVFALAIHGVGALGKLYSEAIESIEHGPIEAVMSTGANWLQVVRFGAVPQVVPQFISFTMYRWDINVRMATVIGLVGGGGIGNLLMSYINSLQWEQAATAIWLIAIVVMLMDHASAVIRERVV